MLAEKLNSGSGGPVTYIEEVFSTYLYTGTGATQTITNGIDLSGKGGLTWIKGRSATTNNNLFDTARGATYFLHSNTTGASTADSASLTSFGSSGFTLGTGNTSGDQVNTSSATYASWTFRKQPKFFDVVKYTGTGANRTISHSLGSTPGCVIIKRTDTTGDWQVYHNGLTSAAYSIQLNLSNAQASATTVWNSTAPTSTVFSVGTDATVNANGGTYVAYLFAHNAGGFGLTGTNNVISCGSFTTDGSGNGSPVTLGYEPQWLLVKNATSSGAWVLVDTMRGMSYSKDSFLYANATFPESSGTGTNYFVPNATGFTTGIGWPASSTLIYIAIRRGPMKVPTDATKVYNARAVSGAQAASGNIYLVPDAIFSKRRTGTTLSFVTDRLRGLPVSAAAVPTLRMETTDAESSIVNDYWWGVTTNIPGMPVLEWSTTADGGVGYAFQRAPGFFDEVCYTGTGAGSLAVTHSLGAVPELIILKDRNSTSEWYCYNKTIGNGSLLYLNLDYAKDTPNGTWNFTTPTAQVFTVGSFGANTSPKVAYLFASLPGISKVGSYTGNGSSQTINCGFTGGARFVLIKRTDSTGNWYVWDTARGMVAGTDPKLALNSTAAETNANWVYTTTGGFQIVTTDASVNANGGSYIFLAVA